MSELSAMVSKGRADREPAPAGEPRQEQTVRPKSLRQEGTEFRPSYGQLLKGLAIGGLLLTGRAAGAGFAAAGADLVRGRTNTFDLTRAGENDLGLSNSSGAKTPYEFASNDVIKCLATYISIPMPTRTGIAERELRKHGIDPYSVHEVTVAHKLRGKARMPLLTYINQTALDIYLEQLHETMNSYTTTGRDLVKMLPKDINERYDQEFSEFEKQLPRIINEAAYHIGQNFKSHGVSLRADPCYIYGLKETDPKEPGTYVAFFPEKKLALAVSISVPNEQISVERVPLDEFEGLKRAGRAQHFRSLTARNAAKEIPTNLLNAQRLKALGFEETPNEAAKNSWAGWLAGLIGRR